MRFRLSLVVVCLCLSLPAHARLGWTSERMAKTYGKGKINFHGEVQYQEGGFAICALYSKDRVVYLRYEVWDDDSRSVPKLTARQVAAGSSEAFRFETDALTVKEIDELLAFNGRNARWLLRGRRKIQPADQELGFASEEAFVTEYILNGNQVRAYYADTKTMMVLVVSEHLGRLADYRWSNRKLVMEEEGSHPGR